MSLAAELRLASAGLRETVADAEMAENVGGPAAAVAGAFRRQVQALAARLNEWAARAEELEGGGFPGARIIAAQEEERRRLARDIHDGPAQILANVVFRIDVSQQYLQRDPGLATSELEQLKALVRQSLRDVRRIIFDLRPLALDDLGLAPALRSYIGNFAEQSGLAVELEVRGEDRRLPSTVELTGYRLVQEALTNAWKHAGAEHLTVRLTFEPSLLRVEVADDGAGFDAEAAAWDGSAGRDWTARPPSEGAERPGSKPRQDALGGRGSGPGAQSQPDGTSGEMSGETALASLAAGRAEEPHYGLRSMRERAALMGGRFLVDSAPGRGTRIQAELPLGR